jgi:hypothetical protein
MRQRFFYKKIKGYKPVKLPNKIYASRQNFKVENELRGFDSFV